MLGINCAPAPLKGAKHERFFKVPLGNLEAQLLENEAYSLTFTREI